MDDDADELLRALHATYARPLHHYVVRLTGDHELAQDVVQEAMVRAWRHPEVLTNGRGSVRGWLLTVVRNLVIDRVRARDARPPEVAEDVTGLDAGPTQRDHADAVAAAVTVHAALGALSPEHRAVLEQVYLHGRNLEEAAAALGVPKGTVKSRSFYALRALRTAMEREDAR